MVAVVLVFGFAASAGAATELEVTTPADGRYQPGSTTPFIITIRADGAVEGTLRVAFEGQSAASQRVEVPGGSEKEVIMLVATMPWTSTASVSFDAKGNENDKTVRANVSGPNGDEIVGVFPELATRELPATAELAVDLGQARFYPVAPDLLDVGPDALSPFSQMLATPGDLEMLTDQQRAALEGWLGSSGGVLMIDAAEGTPTILPLTDRGNGQFAFGIGNVRYTGGVAGTGNFDSIFEPTTPRSSDDMPWGGFFGGAPTSINLARDAGVRVPAIGALSIGLLGYVVAVGPMLWFGLRRTKREPGMWLAVPALAVVTAVGVWVVGLQLRQGANSAHATVIADLPTSRQILSHVLVTSANGGLEGIELPDGWQTVPTNEEFFGGPMPVTAAPIERDGNLLTELDPGGLGVLAAETNQPAEQPSFAIDLRPDGDALVGTVTNLTAFELDEGMVASGQGLANFGKLGAGETKEVKLTGFDRSPFNGDPVMERIMRGDPWSANDGASNPGVLVNWLSRRPAVRSAGFVMAVGWTKEASGPLHTDDGATVEAGRTAFVSVVPLGDETGSAATNRVTFLRGYNGSRVLDVPAGGTCTDMPLTYSVRPVAEIVGGPSVIVINRQAVAAFDVWNGTEWVPGQMAELEADSPVIGLPSAAFGTGTLYIRVQLTCEMWNVSNPLPELRLATTDDVVIPLGATSV